MLVMCRKQCRYFLGLSIFQVLVSVTMKCKAESVFIGTEGSSVDISCKYTDAYLYTPMYLCRDPCTTFVHVLIKSQKTDTVVTKGRYSAIQTLSARSFSVTIKHLILKDSGFYYCGVETWGFDKLTKVKLTVNKAPTVSSHAPVTRQNQRADVTEFGYANTVITVNKDSSTFYEKATSTDPTQHSLNPNGQLLAVCGGVLGLMLCCVLVTVVIHYRKSTTNITSLKPADSETQISPPSPDQEDICHVYDEMLAVYSLAGPAEGLPAATCSTIQLHARADNDYNPYSLVALH